ncbi:MAG TPA: hypothetical protein VNS32_08365, partial [Flavisolibacter sp.]|nr:hypothetical protein [Flavisolibacter sp.]
KEEIDNIRIPVQFSKETTDDGFFSVNMPGKLYSFNRSYGQVSQQQYADMINGSYYMVTRIHTNAAILGQDAKTVSRKVDSLIYENIPGKILSKTAISKNGYDGFDITNRTRRGDCQRYNIFVTPFEVIIFKMSGNGDYVRNGKEADQFFGSIELKDYKEDWKKYSPASGGFSVVMPHQPVINNDDNWQYMAIDRQSGTLYEVMRTDIHNYDFAEEDSFDLNLMEESFSSSDFIDKMVSRKRMMVQGYPALDVKYKCKDGSVAKVRFLIQGPHYYTLVAHGKSDVPKADQFINSFTIMPFVYPQSVSRKDTVLGFSVQSPVLLEKPQKLEMFPSDIYRLSGMQVDDTLEDRAIYKGKLVQNDSTGEKIYVNFYKPSRYYYNKDSSVRDTTHFKTAKQNWVYRSRKKYMLPGNIKVVDAVLGDPASSRVVHAKTFTKDGGIIYSLQTEGDTLSPASAFVKTFFDSFMPTGFDESINTKTKKTGLFFSDFFSKDSTMHKRAVKNVDKLDFDAEDFTMLKKCIQSLSRKEKKYLEVKKDFIQQLSSIKTDESANYLKDLYYAASDTVDLQYTALEALLKQRTSYAYNVFKDIMLNDPPVLGVGNSTASFKTNISNLIFNDGNWRTTYNSLDSDNDDDEDNDEYSDSFMDELTDSLQLTTGIIKDLLPLINIHDYEKPVMQLLQVLVDSNQVKAADYQQYLPKFLIEAKQELKKQVIAEKNKSIEKALADPDKKNAFKRNADKDKGNSQLVLYATLLLPFWDQNPAIPQLMQQLLASNDNRLKYNTAMLMIHHQRDIPDTLLNYFAKLDAYRYELYSDLKEMKKLQLFPAAYNQPVALAKSKLLSLNMYDAPDSIVFLKKLPAQYHERKGSVYFFKYRKKDDAAWKIATVGIISDNPKQFEFDAKEKRSEETKYDFTNLLSARLDNDAPLDEQLEKTLRKLSYAKRNSAAEFYSDDEGGLNYSRSMSFRD